jgi:hypothetical protein
MEEGSKASTGLLFRKGPSREGPQQESWSPQLLTAAVWRGNIAGQEKFSRVELRIARGSYRR